MADSARYTFLPWYRTGLASAVTGTADGRATMKVTLTASVNGTPRAAPDREIRLIGPGDIIGIDPRAIVRQDPRPGVNDFEPNYLAAVEFYDEDYPWRYSPRAPESGQPSHLIPWIALVVLKPGEFERVPNGDGLPRAIVVKDAAKLPPTGELWAWAHSHINVIEPSPSNPAATVSALASNPALGCSRVMAPRRLQPQAAYVAFLVPTFESGRRAGLLGEEGPARDLAWLENGPVKLPVYHEWSFGTSEAGDFEQLVERLRARPADKSLGQRPVAMHAPLPGAAVPPILDASTPPAPTLSLEGALQTPNAVPSTWDATSKAAFQAWLADFVNLAEAWKVDVSDATGALALDGDPALPNQIKLPIILPPSYGRWHANVDTLDPTEADTRWLERLNLDPRCRAAAAFGTVVVQRHQEEFMARAWQQYGELFRANALRSRAQLFREVLLTVESRHYAALKTADLVATTDAVQARVLEAEGGSRTVRAAVETSALSRAAIAPVGRRTLRAGGPVARRFGREAARAGTMVAGLASRRLEAAPRWTHPDERLSLTHVPEALNPERGWLASDWDVWRPRLVAYLEETRRLAERFPRLRDVIAIVEGVIEIGDRQSLAAPSAFVPDVVLAIRDRPRDWIPTLFPRAQLRGEDLERAPESEAFSSIAWNFRQAAHNASEWLTIPATLPPEPPALDLDRTAGALRAALDPSRTTVERVRRLYAVPDTVRMPSYDPLEPIMPHPIFDDATYAYLRELSDDHLVPNLSQLENNTITLLEVNWRFVESFLVGLNYEMARELLWRGYPTDSRGSYFRQFWDVSGIPEAIGADGKRVERFRDIHPIHGWKRTRPGPPADPAPTLTELGINRPVGRPIRANLVLVIRGDLIRRYPNTEVYAVKAVPNPLQSRALDPVFRFNSRKAGTEQRPPTFTARLGPDTFCYGFELEREQAIGQAGSATNLGWYFVLAERFGEPRFGLDEPAKPLQFGTTRSHVRDVTWSDLVRSAAEYDALDLVALSRHKVAAGASGLSLDPPPRFATWGADAGDMAAILLQLPVRVYYHAAQMLRPDQP